MGSVFRRTASNLELTRTGIEKFSADYRATLSRPA
jgi:hypothetical protein